MAPQLFAASDATFDMCRVAQGYNSAGNDRRD
jgi:hypothetical protein